MKNKNQSRMKGNYIVGLGFLLTTFSFTALISGNSRIILATVGVITLVYGFYLLDRKGDGHKNETN